VVVGVQEGWDGQSVVNCVGGRVELLTEWFLLEDEENSIKQFNVLGQVIQLLHVSFRPSSVRIQSPYVVQYDQLFRPASLMIADGKEDAASYNGGQQLLNKES
jgi:hypothetical protein